MPRVKPPPHAYRDDDDDDTSPIVQRHTQAAGTAAPPTTGVASVFALGKRKRVVMPPLDVQAVQIRSGVPIPSSATGGERQSVYRNLLQRMKAGDSIEVAHGYAKALVSASKKLGIKLAVRKLSEALTGVWRLS